MAKKKKRTSNRNNRHGDIRWVNLSSLNNEPRAWNLRGALKERQFVKQLVISGDYETKVSIDIANLDALKTVATQFDHKLILNGVKSPDYITKVSCGWNVDRWYELYHLNKCAKCKELQAIQNKYSDTRHQHSYVGLDSPANTQTTTVTPGQLTVDFTLDKDQTTDHYMRLDMNELARLQKKYAKWIAVIENVKTVKTLEQEKVAQERADREAIGMVKIEDLQKQIDALKKEIGL